MQDESGWLIEHSGAMPGIDRAVVSWLYVQMKHEGFGARELSFTRDANKALRFARKEDAEAVLAMHLGMTPALSQRRPERCYPSNTFAIAEAVLKSMRPTQAALFRHREYLISPKSSIIVARWR